MRGLLEVVDFDDSSTNYHTTKDLLRKYVSSHLVAFGLALYIRSPTFHSLVSSSHSGLAYACWSIKDRNIEATYSGSKGDGMLSISGRMVVLTLQSKDLSIMMRSFASTSLYLVGGYWVKRGINVEWTIGDFYRVGDVCYLTLSFI